jgi:DNA-damage-inducible protein D
MRDDQDKNDQGAELTLGNDAQLVRRQWHNGAWYFSVVDVVAILTESADPGTYWRVLKHRLQAEGASEVVTNCNRLKMRALDGKLRETDAADVETLLRIIQSIPSPKAEPVKQWLARVGAERLQESADSLAGLTEDQRRLYVRDQLAEHNKSLAAAASSAGVLTSRDFAVFQDHGYMGLYGGERARDIHARKELAKGQQILDHMGSEELAANLFRATQTEAKLRRESIQGRDPANQTHREMGKAVREFIIQQGNTPPEQLPTPSDSIQQVRKRDQQRIEGERQPSLFSSEGEDAAE